MGDKRREYVGRHSSARVDSLTRQLPPLCSGCWLIAPTSLQHSAVLPGVCTKSHVGRVHKPISSFAEILRRSNEPCEAGSTTASAQLFLAM